ncbi:MAG TPA: TolC family protein [Prosthecobacter sp.]|nr:TolC family protein [Prosthecobacter sp.]
MKTYLFLLSLSLALSPTHAALSLAEVELNVLRKHPSLHAAFARWQAALARVPQAAAWEDPMLGITLEQNQEMRSGIADAEVMLSQKIPISGIPKAQARVAEAEAAKAYEDLRRVRAELVMRTRVAFVAYASAHQRLELNDENRRILKDITTATRRKIETAEARLGDALQAQAEVAMLAEKRADLEREKVQARVQLNTLMQRPVDAPLEPPAPLAYDALPDTAAAFMSAALRNRPDLLIAARQIAVETEKVDLARRQRRPDPSLQVATRQFNGQGANIQEIDVGVSFPLTFFNRRKYAEAIHEAEAMREASVKELDALRLETLGLVRLKYEEAKAAGRRYLIMRDEVIPQAQKALEARAADFAARKASFLEYNAARVLLQTAQNDLFDRLAGYVAARAELQTLTQAHPVPSLAPIRAVPVP